LTGQSCGLSLAGNCRGSYASFPLGHEDGIQTARVLCAAARRTV
jgi:hypothetical protein